MTLFDHTVNDYITVVCNRMPIFRDGQLVGAAAVTTMQNITETISRLHSEIQDIKKENVTPSGKPALVNPINKGMEEHEQNGVTVPKRAAIIFAPIPRNLPNIFLVLSGGK